MFTSLCLLFVCLFVTGEIKDLQVQYIGQSTLLLGIKFFFAKYVSLYRLSVCLFVTIFGHSFQAIVLNFFFVCK